MTWPNQQPEALFIFYFSFVQHSLGHCDFSSYGQWRVTRKTYRQDKHKKTWWKGLKNEGAIWKFLEIGKNMLQYRISSYRDSPILFQSKNAISLQYPHSTNPTVHLIFPHRTVSECHSGAISLLFLILPSSKRSQGPIDSNQTYIVSSFPFSWWVRPSSKLLETCTREGGL